MFMVKVVAFIKTTEEKFENGGETPRIGEPTRRRFRAAVDRLEAFPLANLTSADAVVYVSEAMDLAELCVVWMERTADLAGRHPGQEEQIVADQLVYLKQLASELERMEGALRDLAEPGWRERVRVDR
jgi:hypothetical protein